MPLETSHGAWKASISHSIRQSNCHSERRCPGFKPPPRSAGAAQFSTKGCTAGCLSGGQGVLGPPVRSPTPLTQVQVWEGLPTTREALRPMQDD